LPFVGDKEMKPPALYRGRKNKKNHSAAEPTYLPIGKVTEDDNPE